MEANVSEVRPPDLEKPVSVNTFKTQIQKDKIVLEFGSKAKGEIQVSANLAFSPNVLVNIIMELIDAGFTYQEKFNTYIGFPEKEEALSDNNIKADDVQE